MKRVIINLFIAVSFILGFTVPRAAFGQFTYQSEYGANALGLTQFSSPYGVTTSSDGKIYVADIYHSRVVVLDKGTGSMISSFGTYVSPDDNGMYQPYGVLTDASGNIYVADQAYNRVKKFSSSGTLLYTLSGITSPMAMAFDQSGRLFVTEYASSARVMVYSSSGTFLYNWNAGSYLAGIAIDANNVVCVSQAFANQITKFDTGGGLLGTIGSTGTGNGQFNNPQGLAFDAAGNLYVAERIGNRLQKFSNNGTFIRTYAPPAMPFSTPEGIWVDENNFIYVTDQGNNKLYKFANDGTLVFSAGTTNLPGQLWGPKKIKVDASNNLYVPEWSNNRIQKFSAGGNSVLSFGTYGSGDGQFYAPTSVAVATDGKIFVLDNNNRIQAFNASGSFLFKFGSGGAGNGQFSSPQDMAIDPSGNIFVADQSNNRIQKFNSSGTFLLAFGTAGAADGQFNYPQCLAIDNNGLVYVGENNRGWIQIFDNNGSFIKKITPTGTGQLFNPGAITVDNGGTIYVGEWNADWINTYDQSGNFLARIGSRGSKPGQFNNIQGLAVSADRSKLFVSDGVNDRVEVFAGPLPPVITTYNPTSGGNGATVTIVGTNLSGATAVTFGGTPAASFNVVSSNMITALVGTGSSGSISVTTPGGTFTTGNFTFVVPPPVISSFSPTSGPTGAAVTITGTGFSSNPSDNFVYFGGAKASVTSATSTTLVVSVPIGSTYEPLSVTTISTGLTGFSTKGFDVTFTSAGVIDANSFDPRVDYAAGNQTYGISAADLDLDGKSDLAIPNTNGTNTVNVLRNSAVTGTINAASMNSSTALSVGNNVGTVRLADIDGDGKKDVLESNYGDNSFSVLRNVSSPGSISPSSFAPRISFTTGGAPNGMAVNDIDMDGKPDVIVVNGQSNTISVFRNISTSGNISFITKVDFPIISQSFYVMLRDLDGDTKPEMIAVTSSSIITIFRNTSIPGILDASSFAAGFSFSTESQPRDFDVADVDLDGRVDLIIPGQSSSKFAVYKNASSAGTLAFGFAGNFPTIANPLSAKVGDLDGDGKMDVVIIGSNTVQVFKNTSITGTLSFATGISFPTGVSPMNSGIVDIDGDGKPEICVPNFGDGTVSILHNKIAPPASPPTIGSFTPASGPIGTSVTITGTNFSPTPANNLVFFGAGKAMVTSASATQLTVTVPNGTTYQPLTVTTNGLVSFSSSPFNVTFPSSRMINATSFSPKVDFVAGTNPKNIAIGDLDGDGKLDMATVSYVSSGTVSIYRNTSTNGTVDGGSFAPKLDLVIDTYPNFVVIKDLDGDGKPELITASTLSSVGIFRNISTPGSLSASSFSSRIDFAATSTAFSIAVNDLDADGKPDLAVVNLSNNTVSILKNTSVTGTISFAPKIDFPTGAGPQQVAIGDIDMDGKADLAISNYTSSTLSLLKNTGTAGSITSSSFAAKVDFPTGSNPRGLVIGDLDGDGKPDLAVANEQSSSISLYRNNGLTGTIGFQTLANRINYATPSNASGIVLDDLDGDGRVDIIVSAGYPTLFRNTGSFNFTTSNLSEVHSSFSIGTGDFNNDGKPDLATPDQGANTVSINKNIIPLKATQTITFNPLLPKTFLEPAFSLTATSSSGLPVSYTSSNPAVAAVTGNGVIILGAGSAIITASQAGDAFTNPATDVQQVLTINKADQTITFNSLLTQNVGNPNVTLAATSSSGLQVTYLSSNPDVATISGSTVTIVGAGTTSILAGQNGDGNYNPALSVVQDLVVLNPNPIMTINFGGHPVPNYHPSLYNIDYSIVNVGTTFSLDYKIKNAGLGSLSIDSATIRGIYAGSFQLTLGTLPLSLAPGDSISFSIAFSPFDNGFETAMISFKTNDPANTPYEFSLSGTGANASRIIQLPSDLNFGSVPIGSTSERDITIKNLGTSSLQIDGMNFPSHDFSFYMYPREIEPGDSVTAYIYFDPVVGGSVSGYLRVVSNASAGIDSVAISGNGTGPISITTIYPASGQPGDIITIVGSGLLNNQKKAVKKAEAKTKEAEPAQAAEAPAAAPEGPKAAPAAPKKGGFADVFFNSISAIVQSASDDTLVVVVPRGVSDGRISVVSYPYSALSPQIFKVTSPHPTTFTAPNLTTAYAIDSVKAPYNGLAVDFDYDGRPDLVTVNFADSSISFFRNSTTSDSITFDAPVIVKTGIGNPTGVVASDVNADGELDFFISFNSGQFIGALMDFEYDYPSKPTQVDLLASGASSIALEDLDGDGIMEVIAATGEGKTVTIQHNIGGKHAVGTGGPLVLNVGNIVFNVKTGDLNGDGKPEIILANYEQNGITVLTNNTIPGILDSTSFAIRTDYPTGSNPLGLDLADVDGDGKTDIVAGNINGLNVSVLRNISDTGNLALADAQNFSGEPGGNTNTVKVVDLSGDGKPEILFGHNSTNHVMPVFPNASSPENVVIKNKVEFAMPGIPTGFAVADFNRDSLQDVIALSPNLQQLTIFQGRVAPTVQKPTLPASNISFSNVYSTEMKVSFTKGNGAKRLVVINSLTPVDFVPSENVSYSLGQQFGSNRIIMNDTTSFVNAVNLKSDTLYYVTVYEYNQAGPAVSYLISGAPVASKKTLPLPNVYVTTPVNAAINQPITLNVTSKTLTGATTYTIELNESPDFTGSVLVKSGTRTQNFSRLQYATQYYTRVKTNLSPDYGKATTFTTLVPNILVTTPANGAVNQAITLNITAKALTGASVYTIELNDSSNFTGTSVVKTGARTQSFSGLSYATKYYARVITDVYPVYGPTTSFTTAFPSIYVTTPVDGAVNQAIALNVSSKTLAGASNYTIELNDSANFTGNSIIQTGGRTINFSGLSYAKTYYTRVKSDIYPYYGTITSFSTAVPNIYATTPADGATNLPITLNITSSSLKGALTYTIELNDSANFTGSFSTIKTGGRTQNFTGLAYAKQYYVRVKTDIYPYYGKVTSFTTATPDIFITTPADAAINQPISLNMTAKSLPGAVTYTIELNDSAQFNGGFSIVKSGNRTQNFTGLSYGHTYYLRVKTDIYPFYGHVTSFSTAPIPYPSITSPADGATNVSWVVNLTASAVAGAHQYSMEAATDSTFSGSPIVKTGSGSSRTISFTLAKDQKYFVRAKTDLDAGWGNIQTFTTGDALSLAYVISPSDKQTDVPTTTNVTAHSIPGAKKYTISLSADSLFAGLTVLVTSNSPTVGFSSLTEATVYYSRVSTDLTPGQWGRTLSFATIDPNAGARKTTQIANAKKEGSPEVSFTVEVYPNPFKDKVQFQAQSAEPEPMSVKFIDLNGKILLESTEWMTNSLHEIGGSFAPGAYFLQVQKGKDQKVIKVLKIE